MLDEDVPQSDKSISRSIGKAAAILTVLVAVLKGLEALFAMF